MSREALLAGGAAAVFAVTVRYRAVGADTGLVATTVDREVGTVAGGGERPVSGNLTVERRGDYRVETIRYQDRQRVETVRTTVRGVRGLEPDYATAPVEFHRFEGLANLPAVQYAIADVSGNRTTLDVSALLTNNGDGPAGGLRVVVQARQADSNIVTDRAEIRVGTVDPGATVRPSTSLTVPDGYNYYLDAVLYRDGVVVGTAQSAANLDPTETVSANETHRQVGLRVEDFEDERADAAGDRPTPTESPGDEGAGFGVGVAAIALVLVGVIARWWSA